MKRILRSPGSVVFLLLLLSAAVLFLAKFDPGRLRGAAKTRSVARVNGEFITGPEFAEALRAVLWRRGETWGELPPQARAQRREDALERLVNDRLLKGFAGAQDSGATSNKRDAEEAFQQFLKQFEPPESWRERAANQGLDEQGLRKMLANETTQLTAEESRLSGLPGRITDADVRSWFDAHQAEFTIPERVRAGHIFLTRHDKDKPDREPEIRELHRKLMAGEAAFEELAARGSDDDSAKLRGGDLGWFTRNRVPPEFADKVFALPVGGTSAPFESHLGWHLVVVREKLPARAATFEEMKDEISAMLETRWREAAVKRLLEGLRSRAKIEKFGERMALITP